MIVQPDPFHSPLMSVFMDLRKRTGRVLTENGLPKRLPETLLDFFLGTMLSRRKKWREEEKFILD